jgi:hypothetical protein
MVDNAIAVSRGTSDFHVVGNACVIPMVPGETQDKETVTVLLGKTRYNVTLLVQVENVIEIGLV